MLECEFRDPWFLALLALAPAIFWWYRQSKSLVSVSSLQIFQHTRKSIRQRLAVLPAVLLTLGFGLLVVALARPRVPQGETKVFQEGIAIMMVVDLSSSMDARDLVPEDRAVNRLSVVKEVFADFVFGDDASAGKGRPNDMIGLVTFAGYADSVCPLTLDHGNLASIVGNLEIVSVRSEDGTAIGDGLGLAVERLRRTPAKTRIAILLTDGVSTAGAIEPLKAAQLAKQQGIKVYCIGVGTNGMAPYPGTDLFGRKKLVAYPVEIDEKTLKKIAEETGGAYFRAFDDTGLAETYAKIDQLERSEISEVQYLHYDEWYRLFAAAGSGLVALALLLTQSVFRTLP